MNRLGVAILIFACSPLAFAQNAPPVHVFGNQRDPLNAQFAGGTMQRIAASPYTDMMSDASLNDVFFINPERGWAVGNRGAIWTTHNGGATWQLQATPIDCTLHSIQFVNESFGIAVGNYWFPPENQGRGVILTTQNGGQSWQLQHTPDLPPLYRVKFFDATTILVAGTPSERCPSGILVSSNAGQTWQPIQSQLSDGFVDADFYDLRTGIGIGIHGILQQFQNGISVSQTANFGLRRVSAVKVNPPNGSTPHNATHNATHNDITAWAVGDRGLILFSVDQGFRWGVVPGMLPGNAAETVDLKTIEVRGRNLWVAGNPGTNIYMSQNGGRTWQATLTGITSPIRKIIFADDNTGWAVGDMGTILATQNGGQTWTLQRSASTKLSVLGIFGDTESLPYEAFAALSANQGFLSGCVLLFRNEQQSSEQENRFHEAIVRSGGSVGMELGTFPVLPRELWTTADNLVEHIQKTTDGRGMPLLRERLVAAIRQWKPEIVLTSNYTNPYTDTAAEEFAMREVLDAVKLAGDPSAYPHHLAELGLAPWNVKKVFLTLKNGMFGDVHLTTADPTARLGLPLEEMSYISRSLVNAPRCPAVLGFVSALPDTHSGKDFFAGIPFLHSSDGRREHFGIHGDFQEIHRHRALQRRNALGLLQSAAKTPERNQQGQPTGRQLVSRASIATHAAELTRRLDPDSAVQILLNMAEQFHQEGDWHAAMETYFILTQNYSRHPLVRQAFVRVMQYIASGEILADELHEEGAAVEFVDWVDDPDRPGYRKPQTTLVRKPIQSSQITEEKHSRVLSLGQFLDHTIPDLADSPMMRFAVASVLRKNGWERESAKYYQARSNVRFDDVWSMRARTEFWLTVQDKSALPIEQRELPMPAMLSVYTETRPFLDGNFDDEHDKGVWQRGHIYSLTPDKPRRRLAELLHGTPTRRVGTVREEKLLAMSQNFGTQAMFLRDSQFLYIGLRCPKVPGIEYTLPTQQQRLRDAGMSDQDRVEILLDIDRDYDTYYSLTIDYRGWVMDACLGDCGWNPQWQVARNEDEDAWYIEAAIPFSSLVQRPVVPGTVWGLAIRRLVPGMGIECWNAENSFDLREGFGLLVMP